MNSLINERIFIQVPQVVPTIGYFSDEATLKEYNAMVDKDYNGLAALKPFTFDAKKREVVGSNIPAKTLLYQKFLKIASYELSGLQKLEDARAMHAINPFSGLSTEGYCYVDLGVVIRKKTERTSGLLEQIGKRNPKMARLKAPVAILLHGLEPLVNGDNVDYRLTDNAVIYESPEFAGNNKSFSQVSNGRPVIQKKGTRTVWNNSALGVSGFYLDSGLSVVASGVDLASSYDGGRVVLHRGAAANAKIFDAYAQNQNGELNQAKSELESRYAQSLKVLRGEK